MIQMAVQVVFIAEDGEREVHEVARLDRGDLAPETLGLSLADAKAITGSLQHALVDAQVARWREAQSVCPDCGGHRALKGHHRLVYRTPFGTLRLASPRFRSCSCQPRAQRSVSPLATLLPERASPELLYLETKFASLVSYGLTTRLLGELLPVERPIGAERVRRHLFQVARSHEAALETAPTRLPVDAITEAAGAAPPDGPLFVGLHGGYVRGREQGWFEVIAGKSVASFHRDGRDPDPVGRCFAFVQTVDERPRARLVDTLRRQGLRPEQPVIFFSDGAETLRRLQRNLVPEAEHVLDWFHVTMRLTVLGPMVKGAWTDPDTAATKTAALERIKWLLWHGNPAEAIDAIEDLADDVAAALEDTPGGPALEKLATTLAEFATYITNNAGHIVDYGERFRGGERISTGFVESTVNQIIDKRFDKRQSMRWTPRGAHLLLQTRTRVINGDLDDLIRCRYPAFRMPSGAEAAPGL